jgi:hypothetical protein
MSIAEGSYRPLFIKALGLLINHPDALVVELEQAQHSLKSLANPNVVLVTKQAIAQLQRLNSTYKKVL